VSCASLGAAGRSESGARADRLGGIERLEDLGESLLGHPAPVVGDLDPDVLAGHQVADPVGLGIRRVQHHVLDADAQCSARAHRVARVRGQVDEDLVDLRWIRQDPAAGAPGPDHQRLVRSEEPLEHRDECGDRFVEVEQLGLLHLAAAERQELLCDAGGAGRGTHHLPDVAGLRVVRPQRAQHELTEAEHRHELVVHLVGDTARQRPHRLEPLGLAELLLRV
jgi:hypothetical protein